VATRRMFEREIMELDDFVDMPSSTRLLYVYLNLDADDEGFLGSPKKVMRAFGGSEDDIKILIAKGFLKVFNSGVIVVTHWHEHNKIRKDRIKPTRYIEEKQQLQSIDFQEVQPNVNQMSTKCQPNVRIGEGSIGEGSIGEGSIGEGSINTPNPSKGNFVSFNEFEFYPNLKESLEDYRDHIKALGKSHKKTDRAWSIFKGKVKSMVDSHGADITQQQVLSAIEGNWKTIYEPKGNFNGNQTAPTFKPNFNRG